MKNGLSVNKLIRIQYGPYKLSSLSTGCIKFLKPSAFHININFINNNIVNWMHRRNIKVYAYTVNSTKALEFAKTCNLDGAFTDIDLIAK